MQQIRATGFDTIRCWIDWASAEPRRREYHFETLEVLTEESAADRLSCFRTGEVGGHLDLRLPRLRRLHRRLAAVADLVQTMSPG